LAFYFIYLLCPFHGRCVYFLNALLASIQAARINCWNCEDCKALHHTLQHNTTHTAAHTQNAQFYCRDRRDCNLLQRISQHNATHTATHTQAARIYCWDCEDPFLSEEESVTVHRPRSIVGPDGEASLLRSGTKLIHTLYICIYIHAPTTKHSWPDWQIKFSSLMCNTLQHTVIHCNALQHTATHYNTLQHTGPMAKPPSSLKYQLST